MFCSQNLICLCSFQYFVRLYFILIHFPHYEILWIIFNWILTQMMYEQSDSWYWYTFFLLTVKPYTWPKMASTKRHIRWLRRKRAFHSKMRSKAIACRISHFSAQSFDCILKEGHPLLLQVHLPKLFIYIF